MTTVSVVGLGYVGLPLACLCVEKGLDVYGVEIDQQKVELINQGISPIDDPDLKEQVKKVQGKLKTTWDVDEAISQSDVVIICVPTPVDEEHKPNLNPLKGACKQVNPSLQDGTLIIIESTIFPGTVEEFVMPLLNDPQGKMKVAHCPERIDPGNKQYSVKNLPRVVGGINEESTKAAVEFYKNIIDAEITPLKSVKAAEATKIMENTFRDVNIAFVNEMAKSFDKAGIDITEVIKGATSKPFGFMPHYPGVGVGGHCISVDPYYMITKAKELGFEHKFLSLAREINESMPAYTVQTLQDELQKKDKSLEGVRIGVLGLAYKANVDDDRESPAHDVVKILKSKKATVDVWDPYLPKKSTVKDLNELLAKVDAIILATNHNEFTSLTADDFKKNSISLVIDGRNCLDGESIKEAGISYHGIGRQ